MGSPVGVFSDKEVEGLSDEDKALLKEHILSHIQTSAEIRRIVSAKPKLLTGNKKIRNILRRKAGALQKRLKKQSKK
jgi:hypothetical protein